MSNEDNSNTAIPTTNMEQNSSNASLGKEKTARFNSPVNITVHSIRARLADPDGISAKAAIDGLVNAGILLDDSPKFVKQVIFTQEKGAEEKTIITITDDV